MKLITDVKTLSKYIPSVVNAKDFVIFEADLQDSEVMLELDFLGTLYDELDNNVKLRMLCEPLVANHAAITFIPQLDLLLTNSGFVVTSNSNQTPASRERVERLIDTCRKKTAGCIENLLTYLANKDEYYEAWQKVKFCCRFDDMPIATNIEFTKFAVGWENRSSMDFRNLYSTMFEINEAIFTPTLGTEFTRYIIANAMDAKLTPIIADFKRSFASAVMGRVKEAQESLSKVLAYVIEHRTDFPIFDAWYEEASGYENTTDKNIYAFGV